MSAAVIKSVRFSSLVSEKYKSDGDGGQPLQATFEIAPSLLRLLVCCLLTPEHSLGAAVDACRSHLLLQQQQQEQDEQQEEDKEEAVGISRARAKVEEKLEKNEVQPPRNPHLLLQPPRFLDSMVTSAVWGG